ncbi:MAG TPA: hypothetical protein VEI97_07305, partial [bacterium]|nr:hypothetical protein [bacterium]
VTANPPRPEAYQTFRVNLAEPGPDPNAAPSLVLTTPANVPSGSGTSISVSNYNDADGDPITVEIDWNNDGTYDETKILAGGSGGGQTWISPSAYVNSTAVTQGRTIPVRYTDGLIAESIVYNPPLAFLLGPNEAPSPGSVVLSTPATVPNGSTTTVSVVSASDAEGDPIQFAIDWDNNPATPADLQTLQAPYTPVTYTSPIVFTGSVPNEGRNIPVTYADPAHAPVAYTPTLAFTLTGPVGSLPQVSLSTPTSVLSGNTAAITVQAANDADGNVIQLTIDWDNNPSTPADVRTIAPPYNTPLTYTSPTPYNNASLSPAGRGIPVTVSDGVNPPVAYAPSLGFTLSANRAPVITGAPALAVNPLPSPATFTMAAGNATAVDPEGDAISYTIANSVNTNTYSGSAFPIGGL